MADRLTQAQRQFSDVNIGSYPSWTNNYSRVTITMDSNNEESLKACHESLKKTIEPETILPANLNLEPWMEEGKDVEEISHEDSNIGRKVKESLRYLFSSI